MDFEFCTHPELGRGLTVAYKITGRGGRATGLAPAGRRARAAAPGVRAASARARRIRLAPARRRASPAV